MFRKIYLPPREFKGYLPFLPPGLSDELLSLAAELRDLRFVHLNSTARGGGVAEILRSLVPLMRSIGLKADWYVLQAFPSFFNVTKHIHDLLQGGKGNLSPPELSTYLKLMEEEASSFAKPDKLADVWFFHDPQLLPFAQHIGWLAEQLRLWVCHIDLSAPNPEVLKTLLPLTDAYNALVFSLPSYVPPQLNGAQVHVIPPAIDPSTRKNRPLSASYSRGIIARLGIDPARPLVTQVSRFDIWKDPWGVIDAYRVVKNTVPDLQLAYLGLIQALDDPDAAKMVDSVTAYANGDPDIHLIWDPQKLPCGIDLVVNAFQVASQVVMQKSVREGFGLTVTEAMWKGTPVVGGNVGGIRYQIEHGVNGYLVENSSQAGQHIVELLQNPEAVAQMGARARESVRLRFLLPRLLRDYLAAVKTSLGSGEKTSTTTSPILVS